MFTEALFVIENSDSSSKVNKAEWMKDPAMYYIMKYYKALQQCILAICSNMGESQKHCLKNVYCVNQFM